LGLFEATAFALFSEIKPEGTRSRKYSVELDHFWFALLVILLEALRHLNINSFIFPKRCMKKGTDDIAFLEE
jgi:hypothetical protein